MTENLKEFIKNFTNWFALKPKLNNRNHKPPFVKEGQIWWCHLGENIGTEISGKSNRYSRPGIVLKKLSSRTFLVIPTSTQIKEGSWFAFFIHQNKKMVACLHQIRVIDYRRLQNSMGEIDIKDYKKIKQGIKELYDF